MNFEERSTHVYRQKQMFSKEELTRRESLCVHEQPAFCVAACPLKLDTKEMLRVCAEGNFNKARQLYEKIAPFPYLLCAGCEAPCETRCKLGEVGETISIRALEQAVMTYGEKPRAGGMSLFRRKKKEKAVLFGADLFLLFLAGELARKTYPIQVFCEEDSLQAFYDTCTAEIRDRIDRDWMRKDLDTLKKLDVQFRFACSLTPDFVEETEKGYEITAVSQSVMQRIFGMTIPHDDALMIWHGTDRIMGPLSASVTEAAFAAKKAALSADRLAQKISPDNSRGEEGIIESALYTNLEGVTEKTRVIPAGRSYSREEAVREAGRCVQCRCDECVKGCAYLQHYKKYPKVLTREIYNNVSIIMGDHMMNKPINACSLCGQCTVTCPNGYDMAEICHAARENMVSTGKMPLAPHEFALHDMLFSNEEAFLCRNQPGYDRCRYVFFPGCQAAAIAPDTVKAAYEDLCERLEGGVALLLGCCGAICDWAGRYEMTADTRALIGEKLQELGDPVVIAGCPMCRKELSEYIEAPPVGIWDILEEIGLPKNFCRREEVFALHDSCGARNDAKTQNTIRHLAEQMGIRLEETPYTKDASPCCGYGGLTAYANREVAKEMTEKCLERSGQAYMTYCMACRDRFAREGRISRHLLELVYGTCEGSPPDISEKRYNRLMLKQYLLEKFWGERMEMETLNFTLEYTEEALQMMDDRMILKSDVAEVMKGVDKTGEAVLDTETDLLVSRIRLGNVTFWVKYTKTEQGYLVHRAYSHRMHVEKRMG